MGKSCSKKGRLQACSDWTLMTWGSRALYVIGLGNIFAFLWLVLNWKWVPKIGNLAFTKSWADCCRGGSKGSTFIDTLTTVLLYIQSLTLKTFHLWTTPWKLRVISLKFCNQMVSQLRIYCIATQELPWGRCITYQITDKKEGGLWLY